MKIYREISLSNFEFWSGAADRASQLTDKELDDLTPYVEELLGDEASETAVNDLFWFDFETVIEGIGLHLNEHGDIDRGDDDEDEDDED